MDVRDRSVDPGTSASCAQTMTYVKPVRVKACMLNMT